MARLSVPAELVNTSPAIPPWWRWGAVVWLAVWGPSYVATWGWRNFFALCDVAVILTCVGLWRKSSLLLSSQALAALLPAVLWSLDVFSRLATGRHLFGGTEYMWDQRVALPIRLLSLFHLILPVVLVAALRRVGYARRALAFQSLLTVGLMLLSRLIGEDKNLNFAFTDPLLHRRWGPAPLHLLVITAGTIALVYLPVHLALSRLLRAPRA